MLIRIVLIFVMTCLGAGCMQVRQAAKRPLGGDGELFLYCEPFSQDAGRLEFTVETVSAIREDGLAVPLTPQFKDFSLADMRRQRLCARGIVPEGRYKGIAIKVKSASLSGEDGKGRLLVSELPDENRALFTVRGGKATVVAMELKYRDAIGDGIAFRPVFTATVPPPPLPELTGYLTNHGTTPFPFSTDAPPASA